MTGMGLRDVHEAARRIAGAIHRTPVLTCSTIDRLVGRRVFFKCENFQKTGSFKARGAVSAICRLDARAAQRGVVASSTGNHAQALAFAARLRGIPVHVVVPRSIPSIKLKAIADYGAQITFCATTTLLADTARLVARDTGGMLISSAEHPDVIAGQGTAALELLDEVPDLGVLVCPTGGGGLLAGSCLAALNGARAVAVLGAEPASADDTARSLAAGRLVPMTEPASSIADGLLVSLAEPSWAVIQKHAAGIVTVSENEIRSALRLIWERMRLLIEPSAAAAVAAVLSTSFRTYHPSHPVGVLLTGGNTALHKQSGRRRPADSKPTEKRSNQVQPCAGRR